MGRDHPILSRRGRHAQGAGTGRAARPAEGFVTFRRAARATPDRGDRRRGVGQRPRGSAHRAGPEAARSHLAYAEGAGRGCRSSDDRRRRIAVDARHAARAGSALTVRRRARADCVGRHRPRDRRNSGVIRGQRHRQGARSLRASCSGSRGPGCGWGSQAAPSRPGQGRSRGHPLRP